MWNRVTQQNIDSFEDFIAVYKLCKSRGTDEQRLEGNRQAYAALRAAELGNEQLFKQAWCALKRFSRKTRPHTDRMFYDYASFTCRSWTDLVLCNLSAEAASLAYIWIDEVMSALEEGVRSHVVRTWNRSFKDRVLWRRLAAVTMFEYRGARALMFPKSDWFVQVIFFKVPWFREMCEAPLAILEAKHLESILPIEPCPILSVSSNTTGEKKSSKPVLRL